jgi:D-3-phosphoglycerate dehydrogenase
MKILVTDKMAEEAIKLLKKSGYNVTYNEMDHDTLLEEIPNYFALMVRGRTKVVKEIVKAGAKGNLRVIGRAGIGVDNIDIETAAKCNIPVVNAPTGATISVAELTLTHMLSLSRKMTKADRTMKKGEWAKKQLKGIELHGKTLGLIGCGNIGKLTAKFAKIFNMKIIGYDPYVSMKELKKEGIIQYDNIKDIMKNADFISLHLPHLPSTHHIINKELISNMKSTGYLINCARGGTVDEDALHDALKDGKIAGAGIDVFEQEPPKNNPLLKLDNVILTPHIGANTLEGQIRAGTVCAEQIIKVLNGKKPDFCVNYKMMKK